MNWKKNLSGQSRYIKVDFQINIHKILKEGCISEYNLGKDRHKIMVKYNNIIWLINIKK